MPPRPIAPLVRLFYRHFYNRFAFTYDAVSAVVSRGEWRAWTDAAIQFVRGPCVLEVAFGTGNLLLDLAGAGYQPVGVDLSPYMVDITRRKLAARHLALALVRARAQQLPFPSGHFDSVIMTFPPGLASDAAALSELHRVLRPAARLVWVDAPALKPVDLWSRLLNWAFRITGGAAEAGRTQADHALSGSAEPNEELAGLWRLLPREGWSWQVQRVSRQAGYVHVMIGVKEVERV